MRLTTLMKSTIRVTWKAFAKRLFGSALATLVLAGSAMAEKEQAPPAKEAKEAVNPDVGLSEDRKQLDLPGIKVLLEERYLDVDSKVCLAEGLLELIACAKDTKEHESVIAIQAKAAHIHAALLLLRAQPGNPAMRKPVEGQEGRWIDLPPRGSKVDVFLVVDDEEGNPVERPISDFIMKDPEGQWGDPAEKDQPKVQFPTHTFLFAGSHVYKDGENPPRYLADVDGNVISISTFGDELLCLEGFHGHGNEGLVWAVDPTHLPAIGTEVILRLRPHKLPEADGSESSETKD